ncbi:MAG TPA: hypothetical protein VIN58_03525 [Roseateles sp.]
MRLKIALVIVTLLLLVAAWLLFAWRWSYSDGERAGWVQKFSRKGWICKTWEGEQALVSLPGTSAVEKFQFTVHDEATAKAINQVMGRRVNLHYEEKVGLPGSCFGETRYFVTGVTLVDEISLTPGVVVPVPPGAPASAASQ